MAVEDFLISGEKNGKHQGGTVIEYTKEKRVWADAYF